MITGVPGGYHNFCKLKQLSLFLQTLTLAVMYKNDQLYDAKKDKLCKKTRRIVPAFFAAILHVQSSKHHVNMTRTVNYNTKEATSS